MAYPLNQSPLNQSPLNQSHPAAYTHTPENAQYDGPPPVINTTSNGEPNDFFNIPPPALESPPPPGTSTPDRRLNSKGFYQLQRAPWLFWSAHPNSYYSYVRDTLLETRDPYEPEHYDLLRTAFLSDENMEIIQKQTILYIYNQTDRKFAIPRQQRARLKIAMLYIYNFWAQNLPFGITDQIRELNKKVVLEIGPQIISQLEQYIAYIRDISAQPVPHDLPVNMSSKGNRTLPSVMSRLI